VALAAAAAQQQQQDKTGRDEQGRLKVVAFDALCCPLPLESSSGTYDMQTFDSITAAASHVYFVPSSDTHQERTASCKLQHQ
jgi:hypothetical protein